MSAPAYLPNLACSYVDQDTDVELHRSPHIHFRKWLVGQRVSLAGRAYDVVSCDLVSENGAPVLVTVVRLADENRLRLAGETW